VRALPPGRLALAHCLGFAGGACHFLIILLLFLLFIFFLLILLLVILDVCARLLVFLILHRALQARRKGGEYIGCKAVKRLLFSRRRIR
jgi:hypothetical protein